jgi:predicted component of type VI protein secretion system
LYPLALLLPSLQALAGTERGIRLALNLLLGLAVQEIRKRPAYRFIGQDELSLLGSEFNRVSVDYVLGDCLEDLSRSELVIGPISLDSYYRFQQPEGKELLKQAMRLLIPCESRYSAFWVVADPANSPRLGIREENSVLGINSYLGPPQLLASA